MYALAPCRALPERLIIFDINSDKTDESAGLYFFFWSST
jgi:hypothetical protein